jgi:putative sigma-54 modulation protein
MRVQFTGRHMDVPREVRELADRKLRKLARVLPGITRARVIVTPNKHRYLVEVSVHSPHADLTAAEETPDATASLTTAMDEITRQAQRRLARVRHRKGGTPRRDMLLVAGAAAAAPAAPAEDGPGPRVIRARRFVAKPMTVEEAAVQVEDSEYGFLVFRDAATERVNVLYRRKDGNLGLIEPEA